MRVKDLLPIGSVVRLENGTKRAMIYGVKQTDSQDEEKEYDYIGVFYPEGYIGSEYQFLFDHKDIVEVYHEGFKDEERDSFIEKLAGFYKEN